MGQFRELIDRIRQGDPRALNYLLAVWRPKMRRSAHLKLRLSTAAREDTSDVIQNALLDAARSIVDFRGNSEGEWAMWLRTIISRQAGKSYRFHHTQKRNVQREESFSEASCGYVTDTLPSILEDVEVDQLERAIEALSPTMKEIVCRRLVKREPYDLIAHDLQITSNYARVQFTRAIRRLRDVLEEK